MAPLATLTTYWCKWWFISDIDAVGVDDANGTNDSSAVIDFNVQWRVWNVEDTSPFYGAVGANEAVGANVANGIILTIYTIVAIETIVTITISIIVNIATILWPMYHHCLRWIVIVTIGAIGATVAIGAINFHWII